MGRDWKVDPKESTGDTTVRKSGWRLTQDREPSPSTDVATPISLTPRAGAGSATALPPSTNGNGRTGLESAPDGTTGTVDGPFWVPEQINYPPSPPSDTRRFRPRAPLTSSAGTPRALLHSMVLGIILTVVLGHGYWDRTQQVVQPGGLDNYGDLRQVQLPTAQSLSTSTNTQAVVDISATGDLLSGYVSELASAVVPEQLNLQVVSAEDNQTIADIAANSGRSVETVLWANGMTDPAAPMAAGTPVRVPSVDGMLHVVHDGDSLESIAARYKVDVNTVIGYAPNNVQTSADLVPYRMIMVPGASMPTRDNVVSYTVRDGDSLAAVAQLFGLHPDTITWANNLPTDNLIYPGQHLAVLPTDGVMVTVQSSDTVEKLAEKWGVEPKSILEYPQNGLGAGGQLRVDQQLMIPGGHPPPPPPPPAPKPEPAQAPANTAPEAPAPPPSGGGVTGRFIWPTSGVITQYYGPSSLWMEPAYNGYANFHQGLDIANGMHTPIVAAEGGTVVFAGWNNFGFGNAVAIDHGNGLVTWYAHMAQQPSVWVGQRVSQGQYVGPMGSTGASTGSHVHFAIKKDGVWVDPLGYLQ